MMTRGWDGAYLLATLFLFSILVGCISEGPKGDPVPTKEYSLKQDRSRLANLRSQVPVDTQKRNDEWALVLSLMSDESTPPGEVRQRFADLVRKVRRQFDSDRRKERDMFNRKQKVARDNFRQQQKREQVGLRSQKPNRDVTKEFYDRQSRESREFYARVRSEQNEFEAEQRSKRADFESYIRAKQKHFDQEFREFRLRYQQNRQKKQDLEGLARPPSAGTKRHFKQGIQLSPENASALREFAQFPEGPGVSLNRDQPIN